MPDAVELVKVIKKAATEAVEAAKPVNVYYGQVQAVNPLQINVEQKMILGEKQLVLSRNVTDFKINATVNWLTEDKSGGSGDSSFSSHNHSIAGKKEVTIHNALEVGEQVILIRQQEGQKYIVIDRIGG